jgi:hypothetical protein
MQKIVVQWNKLVVYYFKKLIIVKILNWICGGIILKKLFIIVKMWKKIIMGFKICLLKV